MGLPRLAASMLCLDKNFLRNLPGDVGGLDASCFAAHSGIRVLIWSTVFVLWSTHLLINSISTLNCRANLLWPAIYALYEMLWFWRMISWVNRECGLSLLPFWMLVPADICRSKMHWTASTWTLLNFAVTISGFGHPPRSSLRCPSIRGIACQRLCGGSSSPSQRVLFVTRGSVTKIRFLNRAAGCGFSRWVCLKIGYIPNYSHFS